MLPLRQGTVAKHGTGCRMHHTGSTVDDLGWTEDALTVLPEACSVIYAEAVLKLLRQSTNVSTCMDV